MGRTNKDIHCRHSWVQEVLLLEEQCCCAGSTEPDAQTHGHELATLKMKLSKLLAVCCAQQCARWKQATDSL